MKPRQAGRGVRWLAKHTFGFWQALGLHVTANHFYEPVPDTRAFPESLWARRDSVPGLDLHLEEQRALTARAAAYRDEFDRLESYPISNPSISPADAAFYYGLVRSRKPATILEIGAGFSTELALAALKANQREGKSGTLTSVEPYPLPFVHELDVRLIEQPLQDVALSEFTNLKAGDVLFIDSSHVVAAGSDVVREFLQIVPQLAKGVLVHVHDIFIPNEYPRDWLVAKKRFWTEQYLLQAFLAFNTDFRVRWAGNYLQRKAPSEVAALTSHHDQAQHVLGSFWFERVA